ncbi:hypothetical protein W97_02921 [Coniosporium apollinis CBS 100218]|uniref:Aminotransferase class V domain-containing protein n=1 Tax=Coniosporium apollinis (strain CBS 100218) TaxID=1168221 RepID=R7YPC3_CONA1|nr:uncharacterized protein W97_02921 [Coniosporium apollinis CBS 100218]EON63693.1 hypothetical protein W97_02921 [Coniosporium apollinis CBS 100218]
MTEANGTPSNATPQFGRGFLKEFLFEKGYRNLNHGSFGTYPRPIRDVLHSFQDQAEARPDRFIRYEYPERVDESREVVAEVLNAPVETLVFVPNATTGVNTVLRNLVFQPGEKILYFATIYGACEKSVEYVTETTPAEAIKIQYTYPVSDDWLVTAFREAVQKEHADGNKVKIAIFDTVVSLPGVRMPFERLTAACHELGVLSCVDGAHGIGHVEIDLGKLDCDFFVSNLHKWYFVPRGCAIFYVPVRNQHLMRSTLPTSHGFVPKPKPGPKIINPLPPSKKSAFVTNYEFVGTIDNSPYLCVPAALKYREALGGEAVIRDYCADLARKSGARVAELLGTRILENEEGTLGNCNFTNVLLPLKLQDVENLAKEAGKGELETGEVGMLVREFVINSGLKEHNTFMALIFYGQQWWVRLSAQIYLEMADFEWASGVLKDLCERVMKGEFLQ